MRSSVGPHASSRETRDRTGDWTADSKTNETIHKPDAAKARNFLESQDCASYLLARPFRSDLAILISV
jgi:hypothetical protein